MSSQVFRVGVVVFANMSSQVFRVGVVWVLGCYICVCSCVRFGLCWLNAALCTKVDN